MSKKIKVSAAIDTENMNKMKIIVKKYKDENYSKIINLALTLTLERIKELIKNPLDLEEELIKRKLEDIKKTRMTKAELTQV